VKPKQCLTAELHQSVRRYGRFYGLSFGPGAEALDGRKEGIDTFRDV
jgi:hypothetical protein